MAGGISEEDIQKVREASDIVSVFGQYVPVRQKGRDFWCCCPLHHEKTPSLKIDPTLGLWHCFGCGEGGDIFAFIMKMEDLSFPESVYRLAERSHIELSEGEMKVRGGRGKKVRLKAVCAQTAAFYHEQLMRNPHHEAAAARSYLGGRGLGGEVPRRWQLGFAAGRGVLVAHLQAQGFSNEEMLEANVALGGQGKGLRDRFFNRIIFPIYDTLGECIAFGGRVLGAGEPKYLNSQETPLFHKSQVLFGLDKAKAAMAQNGVAVVCEGYTDVIALHEAGIKNVVATLGTALTLSHIRLLSRHAQHRIIYLFDGDEAGQRAAERALAFIDKATTPEAGRTQTELAAVSLPDNLDPADFVAQRGGTALQELLDQAQPLILYGIERRLSHHDMHRAEGRAAALVDALSVLAPIKHSILARDYAVLIATRCRADEQDVIDQLRKLTPVHGVGSQQNRGVKTDDAASKQKSYPPLPPAEVNRLRFERQLLRLVVTRPEFALLYADTLDQIHWHSDHHKRVVSVILDALSTHPDMAAAELLTQVARVLPRAEKILSAGIGGSENDAGTLVGFLLEELILGDEEDHIAELKAQMSNQALRTAAEFEALFKQVANLQRDLTNRRAQQKPFISE